VRWAVSTTACAALLSGCALLMGPADAVLRVSGEVSPSAVGPCSLRMVALPSQESMSTRTVSGSFETSFIYYAAARAKGFRFELSCAGSPWSEVGVPLELSSRRASVHELGLIAP
jgi:hypothetical protein